MIEGNIFSVSLNLLSIEHIKLEFPENIGIIIIN